MNSELEKLVDVPDIRLLEAAQRECLISGLRALEAVDAEFAQRWLLFLGTETLVRGNANVVAEYEHFLAKQMARSDYSATAIGVPVIWAVAAPQLPERQGVAALEATGRYIDALFEAAAFARVLGQKDSFFAEFTGGVCPGLENKRTVVRHAVGEFAKLYELDQEVAKRAATMMAGLHIGNFLESEWQLYLSKVTEAAFRLGPNHWMVNALTNVEKRETILKKLGRFPQLPFVFSQDTEVPVSPSFYLVAGEDFDGMEKAAHVQGTLLHQNHFDLETVLIEESMPDIVRRMKGTLKGRVGLVDACTEDGTKFVHTMNAFAAGLKVNGVQTGEVIISNVALVDYNPYLILDAIQAIQSMGVLVEGEGEWDFGYGILTKRPLHLKGPVPVLKLALCQGNVESLAGSEPFMNFKQKTATYLTSLLGTSVCNFDPDTIAQTLHDITAEYCVVSVYLDEGNDAKLRSIYGSELVRDLSANNLRIAGVNPQDFSKFDYNVAVQRWQYRGKYYEVNPLVVVVTYFEARENVKGDLFDFETGQKAPGLLSIKPTDAQFRTIMAANGLDTVAMYRLEDVALYLLKKAPLAATEGSSQTRGNKELTRSLQ